MLLPWQGCREPLSELGAGCPAGGSRCRQGAVPGQGALRVSAALSLMRKGKRLPKIPTSRVRRYGCMQFLLALELADLWFSRDAEIITPVDVSAALRDLIRTKRTLLSSRLTTGAIPACHPSRLASSPPILPGFAPSQLSSPSAARACPWLVKGPHGGGSEVPGGTHIYLCTNLIHNSPVTPATMRLQKVSRNRPSGGGLALLKELWGCRMGRSFLPKSHGFAHMSSRGCRGDAECRGWFRGAESSSENSELGLERPAAQAQSCSSTSRRMGPTPAGDEPSPCTQPLLSFRGQGHFQEPLIYGLSAWRRELASTPGG